MRVGGDPSLAIRLAEQALAALPAGVDAIFLPRDSSIESHIDLFVDYANRHRIPLCAPSLAQVEAGALLKELLKDRSYYEKSGGGVTLSGGEPTLQAGFALELAQQLAAAGITVALDTCGLTSRAALERLLPYVDTILFDVKLVDAIEHEHWTRVSNRVILENLRWLCAALPAFSPRIHLWVRTPVIPGATDSVQNIKGIGTLLAGLNGAVERWELCAFNNLCRDKYDRLGLDWEFAGTPLLTRVELEQVGKWASSSGFDPQRVFVTGAARVEG